MDRTFSIITVGCKLNQYESECIRHGLVRRGWSCHEPGAPVSVCIVNTCTVTGRSDARCRRAVRRLRRASPGAFTVVTGCYAETEPERLRGMREIDLVVGNAEKKALPALIDRIAAGDDAALSADRVPGEADFGAIESFRGRARAFIKIQDGCDEACSYCIVPRARGRSRSVPPADVLRQVRALSKAGCSEIVLAGVHIGRYGYDRSPRTTLAELVAGLLEATDGIRFRLSSIEATELSPALLAIIASTERLAPHFHVPMQSGDDRVLRAMRRPYAAERFREAIAAASAAHGNLGLGTDIIVGFPGETPERFEATAALAEELPFTYFHVFPFSARPGTAAAALDGRVPNDVMRERSARLIALGRRKKEMFLRRQVGSRHLAVIQGPAPGAESSLRALTGNYCDVLVAGATARAGTLVQIEITGCRGSRLLARIADPFGADEGSRS